MHIDGSMEQLHDTSALPALLDELNEATPEHRDVAVALASAWSLTVLSAGRVIWENVEDTTAPLDIDGLTRDQILDLMTLVAQHHRRRPQTKWNAHERRRGSRSYPSAGAGRRP